MPSVVVLLPGADNGQAPPRTWSSLSSSSPSSSSSSRLKPSSAAHSSSVFVPLPATSSSTSSSPYARQSLLPPSSSSSSLASSSLLARNHSSSSSSTSSSSSGHRSRSSRHDRRPVDISNPFGDGDGFYNSFKRAAPSGQDTYVCRWRLRDKKGVLDRNGHLFCNFRLMTPELLARHVLTHHATSEQDSQHHSHKTACKWNTCLNRHYDPAGLAGHLVHDHFTHQMGLKYACIASRCPAKTVLTSYEALDRHHSQYHGLDTLSGQLRKVWQPMRLQKDSRSASQLLAALRKLDARKATHKVSVSTSANPKIAPTSASARRARETEFRRRTFDPFNVGPGEGQEGQPWIRLQKRMERRMQQEADMQSVEEAILRATAYDEQDLDHVVQPRVELNANPILKAIEEGIENAQLYRSSSASTKGSTAFALVPPPPGHCQVVLPQREDLEESITPFSLSSIQREMKFDADLSKQRRWADSVLGTNAASSQIGALKPTSTQEVLSHSDSDDDDETPDWTAPLRFTPYHPSSRCRFAIAEDSASDGTPRAVRRPEAGPQGLSSSDETSLTTSRSISPKVESRSSTLTPVSRLGSLGDDPVPTRLKREREEDHTTLMNGLRLD